MMKSITRTLLTSTMGFAWDMIRAGERVVAFAESWKLHEGNEQRAGFIELIVHRTGRALGAAGKRFELGLDALAIRFGFDDGEVTGLT